MREMATVDLTLNDTKVICAETTVDLHNEASADFK